MDNACRKSRDMMHVFMLPYVCAPLCTYVCMCVCIYVSLPRDTHDFTCKFMYTNKHTNKPYIKIMLQPRRHDLNTNNKHSHTHIYVHFDTHKTIQIEAPLSRRSDSDMSLAQSRLDDRFREYVRKRIQTSGGLNGRTGDRTYKSHLQRTRAAHEHFNKMACVIQQAFR
jgi:hypothetical protein